jgi:hypothetical protein
MISQPERPATARSKSLAEVRSSTELPNRTILEAPNFFEISTALLIASNVTAILCPDYIACSKIESFINKSC